MYVRELPTARGNKNAERLTGENVYASFIIPASAKAERTIVTIGLNRLIFNGISRVV
jgi:hypothetical protein